MKPIRRIVLSAGATAALVCLTLLAVDSLLAHGGGTPQLANAEAGPYRLFAWTQPEPWRAGEVHVTMSVTLPPPEGSVIDDNQLSNMLETPVSDAVVNVRLISLDGRSAPIGLAAVKQDFLGGAYYEADTDLPDHGSWQVVIDVGGPLGEGSADFVIEVLPAQRVNWLWLGLGAAALLAGLGVIGMRRAGSKAPAGGRVRAAGGAS